MSAPASTVTRVRLSRHARNRLRRIRRSHPGLTPARLLEALIGASSIGYDARGNRKVNVLVHGARLTVVVGEPEGLVVTLWLEEE